MPENAKIIPNEIPKLEIPIKTKPLEKLEKEKIEKVLPAFIR